MPKGGFEKGAFEKMKSPGNLLSFRLSEMIDKGVELLETQEATTLGEHMEGTEKGSEHMKFLQGLQDAVDGLALLVQQAEAIKIRVDEIKDDAERSGELATLSQEAEKQLEALEAAYAEVRMLLLPHSSGFSPGE